jgi:uncharacterized protein (UPF0332 family)
MNVNECVQKGWLVRIAPDQELVHKELVESAYDLEKAGSALDDEDYKWGIVKSYYAMFHAARAILFSLGYQEKRHAAVTIVLEELHKQGKIESKFVTQFKAAISAREDADYHYTYSDVLARQSLDMAEEFTHRMQKLLNRADK